VFNNHGCFAIYYDATGAKDRFDRQRTSGEAYPALDAWLISFWMTKRTQWGGMIQNGSKRPKIQISQIQTKPTPSCSACCVDSQNILCFKNGLHMVKLPQSEYFPKQAKKKSKVKGRTADFNMTCGSTRTCHMATRFGIFRGDLDH
jgi:hypothetical protein